MRMNLKRQIEGHSRALWNGSGWLLVALQQLLQLLQPLASAVSPAQCSIALTLVAAHPPVQQQQVRLQRLPIPHPGAKT